MTKKGGGNDLGIVFSLPLPSGITVNSPNGNENWTSGDSQSITWDSIGSVDRVNIDYSTDNGSHWIEVVAGTENDGEFTWIVPATISSTCLVRISDADSATNDSSNAVFTIKAATPPAIGLSHTRLNFSKAGAAVTLAQTLRICSTGAGTINWTAAGDRTWILLDKTHGTGNGAVHVTVDTTGLGNGSYTGTITITDPAATNTPQTVAVTLVVKSAGANPFGLFETPANNATGVTGQIALTGWALDDIEIASVKIYRDPQVGEPVQPNGRVFIGEANLIEGSRPDVEGVYPTYPNCYRAGWGYMLLTNFLPSGGNGTFNIYAFADDREGHSVLIGIKRIICDNAHATLPFGAIDTPGQGETINGSSYVSFGWALTPQPAIIPTNGSTIHVWVDGLPVGHPVYNFPRADIDTLFPDYANTGGAVGYFILNPSALSEGTHSLAWSVEDSLGRLDGIGSKYFSVDQTSGGLHLGTAPLVSERGLATTLDGVDSLVSSGNTVDTPIPLRVRKGFAIVGETAYPDHDGVVAIENKVGEPLAIFLDPDLEEGEGNSLLQNRNSLSRFTGIERFGNDIRPLPVGSQLDSQSGIFTWLPGPGFHGTFEFEFLARSADGTVKRQRIKVILE